MASSLQEVFDRIFNSYQLERATPLKGNEFASYVRKEAAGSIASAIGRSDLIVEGSVGQGNWAEIPWIGIFNPENTTSATRGVYVVYLFSADLQRLYLCQGQGVTQVKAEFGRDQINELRRRVSLIQSRVPEFKSRFKSGPISLNGTTSLAKEYDEAVAYYKAYQPHALPDHATLSDDLAQMVGFYDVLVSRGATDNVETAVELSGDDGADEIFETIEERRRYVRHSRIERKSAAATKAKKAHGLICQGCGFDFARFYGERGAGYIEAHHLIPLHSLPEGKAVAMDPKADFAVLCSNCHRMVHRRKVLLTLKELRDINGVKALQKAFGKKKVRDG